MRKEREQENASYRFESKSKSPFAEDLGSNPQSLQINWKSYSMWDHP